METGMSSKPWEETWAARLEPGWLSLVIPNADKLNERRVAILMVEAEIKLAAQAPAMARALLRIIEIEQTHGDGYDVEPLKAILRDAGVIE